MREDRPGGTVIHECYPKGCGVSVGAGTAYHPGMPRTARHRLRIGLTVILCLLFQQVAIAAYACPVSLPAEPPAVAEECADMGMDAATEVPALCAQH